MAESKTTETEDDRKKTVATHVTNEKAANTIRTSRKFASSDRGWWGPGLYAHVGVVDPTKAEGKGNVGVQFDISHLKLHEGGRPEELSQAQWNRLRGKSDKQIDAALRKLGYDGRTNGNWVMIYPQSIHKVSPSDQLPGGEADDMPDSDFDPEAETPEAVSGQQLVKQHRSEQAKAAYNPEQKRAKGTDTDELGRPGEYGPNGEFYVKGMWIATTDLPKKTRRKIANAAKGKREIEPYKWEVPPLGKSPIFRLGGTELNLRQGEESVFMPYVSQRYGNNPKYIQKLQQLVDKWKAGERYFDVLEFPEMAQFDDVARFMEAEQPIPGELVPLAKRIFGADFDRYKPQQAAASSVSETPLSHSRK
jgi:hypothetical protein